MFLKGAFNLNEEYLGTGTRYLYVVCIAWFLLSVLPVLGILAVYGPAVGCMYLLTKTHLLVLPWGVKCYTDRELPNNSQQSKDTQQKPTQT